MAARAHLLVSAVVALLLLPTVATAADVLWSAPATAGVGRPMMIGYASVQSSSPFDAADEGRLNLTIRQGGGLLLQTEDLRESDGIGSFVLQPSEGGAMVLRLRTESGASGEHTVDGLRGGHHGHGGDASRYFDAELVYEKTTGLLTINKGHGGIRGLIEIRDESGRLRLQTTATEVGSSDRKVTLTLDPSLGKLHARVFLMGRHGMRMHEAVLDPTGGGPGAPLPTVPTVDDVVPGNVGPCEELVHLDPVNAQGSWNVGTTLHVAFSNAEPLRSNTNLARRVDYTLERRLSQESRHVMTWTTRDPVGASAFGLPEPGNYALIVNEPDARPPRRCVVPLAAVAAPQETGTLAVHLTKGRDRDAPEPTRSGTLEIVFEPSVSGHPYTYDVRVVQAGRSTAAPGQLMWAGKLVGLEGPARLRLGSLDQAVYEVTVFPSPMDTSAPLLVPTDAVLGHVSRIEVDGKVVRPTVTTDAPPETPAPAALLAVGALLGACFVGRRRRA